MVRVVALTLLLAAPPVRAGDVYVWTDKDGRRQISDVVPEKYRNQAKKVDVPMQPEQPRQDEAQAPPSAASGGSAPPEIVAAPEEAPPQEPGISTK